MKGLHQVGYTIHRSNLTIDQKEVRKLRKYAKDKARTIFNHNLKDRQDYKRKQTNFPKKLGNKLFRQIKNFTETYYSNLISKEWSILLSLPGCHEQAPHCDYVQDDQFENVKDRDIPLSYIICLQENTKINLWVNSLKMVYRKPIAPIRKTEVKMNVGDVLVFRGDLVHAGSAYNDENIRVHGYLDSKTIKRICNQTYVIHQHAPVAVRKLIIT